MPFAVLKFWRRMTLRTVYIKKTSEIIEGSRRTVYYPDILSAIRPHIPELPIQYYQKHGLSF